MQDSSSILQLVVGSDDVQDLQGLRDKVPEQRLTV